MSLGEEPELERGFNNEALLQKLQTYVTPAEKIAAVLKVKNQIAQQSNTVFQVHVLILLFESVSPSKIIGTILFSFLYTNPLFELDRPTDRPTTLGEELNLLKVNVFLT